ncbi:MAG TPA: META domain-containing protein [Acidobacteriaceae bacterium]|jgi:heat shock protein HslJ|nr:META domain-containing protein [Acidobacteriaceae bacterium]
MTRRNTILSIVTALLVASVLPAQQPAPPKAQQHINPTPSATPIPAQTTPINGVTPADLEGHQWRLSQFYAANKLLITLPLRVPIPYFAFRDGKIEGSAGCGQFTGTYRGTDDKLAISAKLEDASGTPCNGEQKDEASKILHALASVRRIRPVDDALLLQDKNGVLQVRLEAMRSGKDLSELYDTFWLLKQVEGSTQDLSHVVIYIDHTGINFITPSYKLSMLFQYDPRTGRKFFTSYVNGGDSKSSTYIQDQQVANAFENALQKIASYETKQGNLTFYDKDRQLLFVLNPIQSAGIENRQWRIAKYRGDASPQADKDGLIDATEPASVLFMNGRVDGTPGTGTYKLSGDELSVNAGGVYTGAFIFTQQIVAVLKAFKSDLRIEHRGNQILLRDNNGQAQILLVPF